MKACLVAALAATLLGAQLQAAECGRACDEPLCLLRSGPTTACPSPGWRLHAGWLNLYRADTDSRLFTIGDRDGNLGDFDDADDDLFDNDDGPTDTSDDGLNDLDDLDDLAFNPVGIGLPLFGGENLGAKGGNGFEVSLLGLPGALAGLPIGSEIGRQYGVELRYFQVNNLDDSATFAFDDDDLINGAIPIEVGRDGFAEVRFESDLYNGEINLVGEAGVPNTYILAGFRYLHLDERLGVAMTSEDNVETAFVGYDSGNDLFGLQLGAMTTGGLGPVYFSGLGKVGIYGVSSTSDFTLLSDADFSTTDTSGDVGFVGEIGLNAGYRLNERFSVEAGYRLLWITGVALATEQPIGSNFQTGAYATQNDGSVFLHGLNLAGVCRY